VRGSRTGVTLLAPLSSSSCGWGRLGAIFRPDKHTPPPPRVLAGNTSSALTLLVVLVLVEGASAWPPMTTPT
jgi:hypothetical protein